MSFRLRVAAIIAASVAVVVAALTVAAYVYVRSEVNGGLDRSLRTSLQDLQQERSTVESDDDPAPDGLPRPVLRTRPGVPTYFVQLVAADGTVSLAQGASGSLPVTPAVRRLARSGGSSFLYDADVKDTSVKDAHVRVLAAPYSPGTVVLVAAPFVEVEQTLRRLQVAALLAGLGGALFGGLLGLLVTGATVRPLRRLTVAAEQIAVTRDLSTQLPVRGRDEVSRLTTTFNAMLLALRDAEGAQRRLVADASHELRTPLTSLRVNVELLAGKGGRLPAGERKAVLEDVVSQARELGDLMAGILELARGQEQQGAAVEVEVEEVIARALTTARRDWPTVQFDSELTPWRAWGDPDRLQRAIVNVLGNAAKYGGAHGPVRIVLDAGVLTVTDNGPGIAKGDQDKVFERFYRAPGTQNMPGSGLGLAIVRQALTDMGGTARAETAPGGGAVLILDLREAAPTGSKAPREARRGPRRSP